MKKLFIILLASAIAISSNAQSLLSTNITAGAGLHLLTGNRMKVYSIEVSSTNSYAYRFFDNDNVSNVPTSAASGYWGTNFVNAAYVSKSSYATNIASSYTNYQGGISWYTNAGLWSVTTTNAAATNAVAPLASVTTAGAETRVVYNDAIFTRGVVLHTTGNGNITLYYRLE